MIMNGSDIAFDNGSFPLTLNIFPIAIVLAAPTTAIVCFRYIVCLSHKLNKAKHRLFFQIG
jgi:hypothetical protein